MEVHYFHEILDMVSISAVMHDFEKKLEISYIVDTIWEKLRHALHDSPLTNNPSLCK